MKWLVEHAATLRNRYSTTQTGETPYELHHGQKAHDRAIEFGEGVFYLIPKKLRAKRNITWKLGVYLGDAPNSNESFVGTWCGDVIRARGLVRVVEGSRWSHTAIQRITGTPAKPNPSGNQAYQSIEESVDPYAGLDDKIDKAQMSEPLIQEALSKHVRITQADLKKYGYSEGCPRCTDLSRGHHKTNKSHSEECRIRIFGEYETHDPGK